MFRLIAFALGSALLLYVSRESLFRPHSHGFYRFFAWESISALVLLNTPQWFRNPLSPLQLISWLLLAVSIVLVSHGVHLLRVVGKPNQDRSDPDLFSLEKTSCLVTVGIYKYIRHPLYSSLLFLTWGAFLKETSWLGLLLAFSSSLFLLLTAKSDEAECQRHFGDAYQTYMDGTKRFIPFLF